MSTFTAPTYADFIARFPKYAAPSLQAQIEALLAEALVQVDDSWLEDDRTPAILYLTAHLVSMETGQSVDRSGSIVSESFGPMSISYGSSVVAGDQSTFGQTEYGRRYAEYRDKNFPGIAIAGAPA